MRKALFTLLLLAVAELALAQTPQEKLDAYCKAAETNLNFNGTVLVKKKGQVLLSKGYGFANHEEKITGNENTRYQVGSVTKQFTATVILKLVEQGKLSLNDKLSKWYPNFPKGDKVTIEQMLTHTSGIHSYTGDPKVFDSVRTLPVTEKYMVNLFASYPYDFEPGTNWSYSNSAYSLLGYIIQKVTSKPYEKVVREMILEPMGMSSSGFDFKGAPAAKAIGYDRVSGDRIQRARQVDSTVSFSAGSLYSTTADLVKWDASLYSGKVISVASMQKAHTPKMNKYGYGWAIDTVHGRRVVQHGGGIDGFLCQNYVLPEDDIQVIVLTNVGSNNPGQIANDLLGIVLDQPVAMPEKRKTIAVDASSLEVYAGEYELAPGMVATFTVKDGKLLVDTHHDPIEELVPKAKDLFAFSSMDATLEFVKGATGKVEKFVFRQGAMQREARKIK